MKGAKKMTKRDIVREAARAARVTQGTAEAVLSGALEAMTEAIAAGEPVKINGYGTFKRRPRQARQVINFATGDMMEHPAHNTVTFTPAKALKRRVNVEGMENGTQGTASTEAEQGPGA